MSLLTLLQLDLGVAQLQARAAGIGRATASLSVRHNLVAGPIGIGLAAGSVSVKHQLIAAPIGVSLMTGALTAQRILRDFEDSRLSLAAISTEVRTF